MFDWDLSKKSIDNGRKQSEILGIGHLAGATVPCWKMCAGRNI